MKVIAPFFQGYLTRSTIASIGAQITSVVLSAILGIFLARMLGADKYGDFVYCYTWLLIAVIPAKLGMDTTVMKYIADYSGKESYTKIKGIIHYSLIRTLWASISVSILALLVLLLIENNISDALAKTALYTALCIPPLSILHVLQYSFYGYRHYVYAQLPESIIRPVVLIMATLGVFYTYDQILSHQVMAANFFITTFLCILAILALFKIVPSQVKAAKPQYIKNEWKEVGFSMLLISGMNFILSQMDIVLIGYYSGTFEAGLYAAAVRISALVLFFYTAINSVAAPLIARSYNNHSTHELKGLSRQTARGIFILTCLPGIFCWLFGHSLLSLFGEDFQAAYFSLVILVGSQIVRASTGIGGFLLTMTGNEKISARLSFMSAFVNFLLCLILIPKYGSIGGAWATLISTLAWTLGTAHAVRVRLKFLCTPI